jgi:hypothetical protein
MNPLDCRHAPLDALCQALTPTAVEPLYQGLVGVY